MKKKNKPIYNKIPLVLINIFVFIFAFLCIYPFFYVFIYSISDPDLAAKGITFWPRGFSLSTYKAMLSRTDVLHAFFISLARAVVGAITTILGGTFFSFLIRQKKLPFRTFFYRLCIISMYINAGLIPWYLTMKAYGLKDNFLLYVLPTIIVPFYIILVKTYMESLPDSLEESAKIEGAGYLTTYWLIIMPVCKPIIAVIAIFMAVQQWNTWVDNFFLINDGNLQTLQIILYQYLNQAKAIAEAARNASATTLNDLPKLSTESVKMCTTMITTIPVLLVYPFMQRYFTGGIMLGSVKG